MRTLRTIRRRLIRDERGVSLTELMVASFVTLVIAGAVVGWVSTVHRQEALNDQDVAAVDDLRTAKSRITKELRFASGVYPDLSTPGETVVVWIDADKDGGSPETGETITWAITAGGDLTRTTDTGDVTIHGTGFDQSKSSLSIDGDGNVHILLVATLMDGNLERERSIDTTVNVRAAG